MIRWIIKRNHTPIDPKTLDAEVAGVDPIPAALWTYGIENLSGALKTFPADQIRAALLPSETATITRRGLKFKNEYYTCETAIKEEWFVLTSGKTRKVECQFDPRNAGILYVRLGKATWEKCRHINPKGVAVGRTWAEVNEITKAQTTKKDILTVSADQYRAELNAEIKKAVKNKTKGKRQVSNIREAHQEAVAQERAKASESGMGEGTAQSWAPPIPLPNQNPEQQSDPLNEVKRARLRMLKNENV